MKWQSILVLVVSLGMINIASADMVQGINIDFVTIGNAGNPGDTETYTCAIDLQYYDKSGSWTINASIYDNAETYAENLTFTMTYDPLTAMILGKSSLNFTNAAMGEQNKASDENPQVIDNRGNQNITQVNVSDRCVSICT